MKYHLVYMLIDEKISGDSSSGAVCSLWGKNKRFSVCVDAASDLQIQDFLHYFKLFDWIQDNTYLYLKLKLRNLEINLIYLWYDWLYVRLNKNISWKNPNFSRYPTCSFMEWCDDCLHPFGLHPHPVSVSVPPSLSFSVWIPPYFSLSGGRSPWCNNLL